ncbi:MAG: hypothetical protein V1494_01495 [Candidatus Diapherotrites archaeon]
MAQMSLGMLMLGIAIGLFIPEIPEPFALLNPYLGFVFLLIGIVLFIKGGN